MTNNDYEIKLFDLTNKYQKNIENLNMQYVTENTKYQIGDVVEDHVSKLLIKKIKGGQDFASKKICAIYVGTQLRKNGTESKIQTHTTVWGTNVIGGWSKDV